MAVLSRWVKPRMLCNHVVTRSVDVKEAPSKKLSAGTLSQRAAPYVPIMNLDDGSCPVGTYVA